MSSRVLLCTSVVWPYAARLAGAFARAGAHVEALFPHRHPMRFSRHLNGQHAYSPLAPVESLRRAIAAAAPDLIVACDDRAMAQLRKLHDEAEHPALAELIARSFGDLSAYPRLAKRHGFISEVHMIGVTTAPSMAVANEKELEAAIEAIGLPAVLKTDESWGGDGVTVVKSLAEAQQALRRSTAQSTPLREMARAMKRRDAHFLQSAREGKIPIVSVQKFIAGQPATSSFACWQGEIVGINHFDVVESCGPTGPASVVRHVTCPWMQAAAEKIASHYSLSGLHGLDFMRDREGIAHLIEINPRATPTSYLELGIDHDPTASLLTAALGHPATPRAAATTNDLIALFPQEWLRDPKSPHFLSAFHDAPWDDPALLRASLGPRNGQPLPTRRSFNDNNAEMGLHLQF